ILNPATMKFGALFFVAALASSTQALELSYKAYGQGPQGNTNFDAAMWVEDIAFTTNKHRGSSVWKPLGIHKAQLRNADISSFEYCIDVFGDIDCQWIYVGTPKCAWNSLINNTACQITWIDNNWGN
ncbi:hypothetical protein BGW39_001642, partial [Mortierella sp. 14UC]